MRVTLRQHWQHLHEAQKAMFGSANNLKILFAVIGLIAIDMMDNLVLPKRSAQHFLGYKSVLSLPIVWICPMNQIAMPIQCPAFITGMLRALAGMRLRLYTVLMNPFPCRRLMNTIMATYLIHRFIQGKVFVFQFLFGRLSASQGIRVPPNIGRILASILIPFSWCNLATATSTRSWFGRSSFRSHILFPGIGVRGQHIAL